MLIRREQGLKLSKKIKSYTYVECSALIQKCLHQVFEEAIRAVRSRAENRQTNVQIMKF
jgi:hypothetical protein